MKKIATMIGESLNEFYKAYSDQFECEEFKDMVGITFRKDGEDIENYEVLCIPQIEKYIDKHHPDEFYLWAMAPNYVLYTWHIVKLNENAD